MPNRVASVASAERASRRTVASVSTACAAGTSMSRTIRASGSSRQRLVGRTRSRVSAYVTGASTPPSRIAAVMSVGVRMTSGDMPIPKSASAKPTNVRST